MHRHLLFIAVFSLGGLAPAFAFDRIHDPIRQMTRYYELHAGTDRARKLQKVLEDFAEALHQYGPPNPNPAYNSSQNTDTEWRLSAIATEVATHLQQMQNAKRSSIEERTEVLLLIAEAYFIASASSPEGWELAGYARRSYASLTLIALAGLASATVMQEPWSIFLTGGASLAGLTLTYANKSRELRKDTPLLLLEWMRNRAMRQQAKSMVNYFWTGVAAHPGIQSLTRSPEAVALNVWNYLARDSCGAIF